jgi:ribosome biogenesis GTPase
MKQHGLVIASHGRHVVVESEDGSRRLCHPRGKKNQAVVGDRVWWLPSSDEGSIEAIDTRRNLFYRQDEIRTKSFAANLDRLLVLIAAEPEFSQEQLTRALIAAEAEKIQPLIVLNKQDLAEPFALAWERLAPYRSMGYEVLPLSLKAGDPAGLATLCERLTGHTTLVLGPSGAGKSSLINRLVPNAGAATGELSLALQSGRHTTTTTTWYWVDRSHATALIDSPGFQAFGLQHLEPTALTRLMPDLLKHAGECRFYNCTHRHEPGCHVQAAVARGEISESRHRLYQQLFEELSQPAY